MGAMYDGDGNVIGWQSGCGQAVTLTFDDGQQVLLGERSAYLPGASMGRIASAVVRTSTGEMTYKFPLAAKLEG